MWGGDEKVWRLPKREAPVCGGRDLRIAQRALEGLISLNQLQKAWEAMHSLPACDTQSDRQATSAWWLHAEKPCNESGTHESTTVAWPTSHISRLVPNLKSVLATQWSTYQITKPCSARPNHFLNRQWS